MFLYSTVYHNRIMLWMLREKNPNGEANVLVLNSFNIESCKDKPVLSFYQQNYSKDIQ